MRTVVRLLFVCGMNKRRSPTAEALFRNDPRLNVRSAGVAAAARRPLSTSDVAWADLILVMERRYKQRIVEEFQQEIRLPPIESLDIPDHYERMEPELIDRLHDEVERCLEEFLKD